MIDRLFFSALGFALVMTLASALASAGTELWAGDRTAPTVVQLERVVVVGQRLPARTPVARAEAVAPTPSRLQ